MNYRTYVWQMGGVTRVLTVKPDRTCEVVDYRFYANREIRSPISRRLAAKRLRDYRGIITRKVSAA